MSPAVQYASIAAWGDEAHVRENRALYREKFAVVTPLLQAVLETAIPEAGFYVWARVPGGPGNGGAGGAGGDDARFARELFAAAHVTVLPGQYLAREAHGVNPGHGYVRIALVPGVAECVEGARRIAEFCRRGR